MPKAQIDLFWFGQTPPHFHWLPGQVRICDLSPKSLSDAVEEALSSRCADALLFWDSALGEIPLEIIRSLLETQDDAWHAGLRLGMARQPKLIDFVSPNWMLNRDPSSDASATSWRVSLRACLVRTAVLRQMGFLDRRFISHDVAGLEWGHRCMQRGVLCRHQPDLVRQVQTTRSQFAAEDELRFVLNRFGKRWAWWATLRAILSKHWSPGQAARVVRTVLRDRAAAQPKPYRRSTEEAALPKNATVSILIPTIDRYPYLQTLLAQLRVQTVPADEIIIVDQTPQADRKLDTYVAFQDLPIQVVEQNTTGQSSARNAGLHVAKGEYILFIDDDDEVPADLIEKHLTNLGRFGADVSSGVANEVGAGNLPEAFSFFADE